MSFGTNIQFLRKRQGVTQEELAEKLDVSRQTVSKWESDAGFPEMEKILTLCGLFGCDMDTLLRGDAAEAVADDTAGYDRHMNGFTQAICVGAALPLAGVAVMLLIISRGLSATLATMAFLTFALVSASVFIVGGIRHGDFVRKHPQIRPFYQQKQIDAFDRRFPLFIVVPTALILLGVIGLMGVSAFSSPENSERLALLWVTAFMAMVAVSVPGYIYGGMQKAKYDIARYNQNNAQTAENKRRNRVKGAACTAIMLLATAVYLVMGLGFDLWRSAPIPFAVGGLMCAIVSVVVGGTGEKE